MTVEKTQQATLETILRPGQIVAEKYCVDSLIGKGGMAAVWAGTNQRTGKRVALKVILRSFASSPEADEMFRREALAASRVNHPNVVNVFDVVDHEGMTCIVMELLDGESLGAYLAKRGPLSVEEAVALLLPAMRGVAAANAQGIIHRDLKPQNLFICIGSDGRLITTKVLDFGISVMVEKATRSETVVTAHGTPAYMSPEHIMNAPDIDERADVYGFGVLLFESLTGHLPFSGEPGPSLLVRILNEQVPKASVFRADLRPDMVDVIARATAKSPNDRFRSVNELIRALEDHFLPPLPLPRSLTPMVGVPLFEQPTTGAGAADPVVQMVRRAEISEEHGANETRQLFGLSLVKSLVGTSLVDPESSQRAWPPSQVATPAEAEFVSTDLMAVEKLKRRLPIVATAAAFVGALILVAWLAMPRHHEQSARLSTEVAPAPAMPSVSVPASPTEAPPALPASSPSLPPAPTMVPPAPDKPIPVWQPTEQTVRPAARPSPGRSPSRGRSPARQFVLPIFPPAESPPPMPPPPLAPSALAPPPLAPSPQLPAPRAGALSADDF